MAELFTLDNGEQLHLDEFGSSGPNSTTLVALHGLGGAGYLFAGIGQSSGAALECDGFTPSPGTPGEGRGGGLREARPSCNAPSQPPPEYRERRDANVPPHSGVTPQSLGIRSLCPDLPGNGLSPLPKQPITFDYFADAVVQLIQRKTTGRIALLGHSMGAIIALQVYAAIPDRIASLIFVGGLPTPLPQAQSRLRERAALIRATGLAAVTPTIIPVLFAERAFTTIPDKIAMFTRLLAQSDGEGYAQTAEALADASAADVAPRVRVPCLCITGAEDRYAPPNAVRAFADSISGAVYREIPNCGHMPFYETPDEFNGMVQSFLKEVK